MSSGFWVFSFAILAPQPTHYLRYVIMSATISLAPPGIKLHFNTRLEKNHLWTRMRISLGINFPAGEQDNAKTLGNRSFPSAKNKVDSPTYPISSPLDNIISPKHDCPNNSWPFCGYSGSRNFVCTPPHVPRQSVTPSALPLVQLLLLIALYKPEEWSLLFSPVSTTL